MVSSFSPLTWVQSLWININHKLQMNLFDRPSWTDKTFLYYPWETLVLIFIAKKDLIKLLNYKESNWKLFPFHVTENSHEGEFVPVARSLHEMDFLIHATFNPFSIQSDRTDGKIWLIGNHIKNLIPMRNSLTDLDLWQ